MEFISTWLYIKRHNVTDLKYFGKTSQTDVLKYKGSGRYWKKHLKQHGNDVTTVWFELFLDEESLTEFAEFFTEFHNIIKSVDKDNKKTWANLVPEDGKMGGQNKGLPSPLKGLPTGRDCVWKGKKRPDHSETMSGRKQTVEHSNNISIALTGKQRTPEHSAAISTAKVGISNPKLSLALKGRLAPKLPCIHCGRMMDAGNMKQHHGNNCKLKDKEI